MARRVAALEASLNPAQLVRRWLAEAHRHRSLTAYGDALADLEPEDMPLNRLYHAAARGARAGIRSHQPEQVSEAVRRALRETGFRFQLALRINFAAHQLLDKARLRGAHHAALLAYAARASETERRGEAHAELLVSVLRSISLCGQELDAAAEARRLAEERYLEGASALFTDVTRAWDDQRTATRELHEMAETMAEMDGIEVDPGDVALVDVDEQLGDLVDISKVEALEKLDEEVLAAPLALHWLRTKRDARLAKRESTSTQ